MWMRSIKWKITVKRGGKRNARQTQKNASSKNWPEKTNVSQIQNEFTLNYIEYTRTAKTWTTSQNEREYSIKESPNGISPTFQQSTALMCIYKINVCVFVYLSERERSHTHSCFICKADVITIVSLHQDAFVSCHDTSAFFSGLSDVVVLYLEKIDSDIVIILLPV